MSEKYLLTTFFHQSEAPQNAIWERNNYNFVPLLRFIT